MASLSTVTSYSRWAPFQTHNILQKSTLARIMHTRWMVEFSSIDFSECFPLVLARALDRQWWSAFRFQQSRDRWSCPKTRTMFSLSTLWNPLDRRSCNGWNRVLPHRNNFPFAPRCLLAGSGCSEASLEPSSVHDNYIIARRALIMKVMRMMTMDDRKISIVQAATTVPETVWKGNASAPRYGSCLDAPSTFFDGKFAICTPAHIVSFLAACVCWWLMKHCKIQQVKWETKGLKRWLNL